MFGAVRRFDTFYFYWLKNNAIVNKNRMSQLLSQGKHFRKGAAISLMIKLFLLNLREYPCEAAWLLCECREDDLGPSAFTGHTSSST